MSALRERIAALAFSPAVVEDIMREVAEHMASDAAVERAKRAQYRVSGHMASDASMKAALAAAIGDQP